MEMKTGSGKGKRCVEAYTQEISMGFGERARELRG